MGFFSFVLMGLGLAMDAFAVSVTSGFAIRQLRIKHAFRIALFFGGFQAIMPVIGWLAGLGIRDILANFDHWIAFGLLLFIGGKMIVESFRFEKKEKVRDPMNLPVLLMLAVATSIDALAVGITFSVLGVSIIAPVIIIGLVTFILSFAGVYIGDHFGHFFEKKIEIIGGIILIGIGIKILIDHVT